jgi:hypothetical protein
MTSWRCRVTRLPFGDQAIFIDREYFSSSGGYRDIPIMEDVDLVRRIKKRGDRLRIVQEAVRTSPRRLEEEGAAFCGLRCLALLSLYSLGVPAERLK